MIMIDYRCKKLLEQIGKTDPKQTPNIFESNYFFFVLLCLQIDQPK